MIYNIVDSVKGGCGKTSFAIMLALLVDRERAEKRENDETMACLLDMDIQGTDLLYLLFGRNYLEIERRSKTFKFMNDWILGFVNADETRNFVHRFSFNTTILNLKYGFDVACCNPQYKEKRRFRAMSSQNYHPEVLYGTYRMGLMHVLSDMASQKPYEYSQIIFDMPPNSDGYSDAVYDVLLKKDYSVMEGGDICNLFLLQTMDLGQRYAALEYLQELQTQENFEKINRIFFVYNDWLDFSTNEKNAEKKFWGEAVNMARNFCRNNRLSEKTKKKIFFVGLRFQKDYYRLCTQQDGIINADMPSGLIDSVKFLLSMEEETVIFEGMSLSQQLLALVEGRKK